jgi:nitrite reductase/ring-hydroxylating ferredoxin subunit
MPEFVKVAKVSDIPSGEVIGVNVGDRRIVIANVDGKFYGIDAECTHQGAPLDEGFLEKKVLTCPWHAGDWNVETGEAQGLPVSGTLPTYKVRVTGDDLEVETPL